MRKSTALYKNVPIVVRSWHDIHGVDFIDFSINGVYIGKLKDKPMHNLESATEYQFVGGCEYGITAKTIKVDKGELFVNGQSICELSYGALWSIHGAFHKITGYTIHVDSDTLHWVYTWSLDWHVQNLSHRVEDVETLDYEKTLAELKKKYEPLVEHNQYFGFEIIEYRGDNFNRVLLRDTVGCVPNNFDEKIRQAVFKE